MTKSLARLDSLVKKNPLASTPSNDPQFSTKIRDKAGNEVTLGDPRATRAAVALMNQHAVIGGAAAHWGGPASFAEMMSALHAIMFKDKAKDWFEKYNFVNDAGHAENGIYALRANYGFDGMTFEDLKGFRSIESKFTGHGEAHLNPEGVYISNGPLGSGLPQAQGLALADRILGNDRVTVCAISDGASMEGEAKESFAAIPGLAARGALNPFVMLISDNNTKLSGRINEDSFSMNPTFASLEAQGWTLIKEENGHDLEKVYQTIETALETATAERPVAVWFKTIKGYGVKSTEQAASGGHGYPLNPYDCALTAFVEEIYNNETPEYFKQWADSILKEKPAESAKEKPAVVSEKVQPGFARATIAAAKAGLPVFSVTADLQGSTGIAGFHKEFPDRYVDVGVAESNMISTAAGLSKAGLIPIVDTFAQFGVTKGNLPLTMSALSLAPVIGLFSHTGFQDAADGASHQATTYFSATSSLPHTTVISCACSEEAESYMGEAIRQFADARKNAETPENYLFFFGRENYPAHYGHHDFKWGKAQVLKEGSDLTIVATGPTVKKALQACELLESAGISASVVNNVFVNRPDVDTISAQLAKTGGRLLTVEDHQLIGGMGALLTHALSLAGTKFSVQSLGIPGKFGQSAYKADQLYAKYGLGAEAIKSAAALLLKN